MLEDLPRLRVPRVDRSGRAGVRWARGAVLGPLVLADGSAAAEQTTTVRVGWDPAALYIRFECADRDAWGTLTRRNDPIYGEEAVEVFLSPGEAEPVGYWELEVSPLGTLFAARIENPTGRRADLVADTSWACAGLEWQAMASGANQDWWAALAIPWSALADGPGLAGSPAADESAGGGETAPSARLWRANFYRIERPRDGTPAELSCWSPTLTDPPDFHQPARFGVLELDGLGYAAGPRSSA